MISNEKTIQKKGVPIGVKIIAIICFILAFFILGHFLFVILSFIPPLKPFLYFLWEQLQIVFYPFFILTPGKLFLGLRESLPIFLTLDIIFGTLFILVGVGLLKSNRRARVLMMVLCTIIIACIALSLIIVGSTRYSYKSPFDYYNNSGGWLRIISLIFYFIIFVYMAFNKKVKSENKKEVKNVEEKNG